MLIKRKIRVLIIEDSKFYQVYIKKQLQLEEYIKVVGCAQNVAETREILRRVQPDVITLDLHLPFVNDYELLRELVAKQRAPIIVVTSSSRACEEALALGASDFLEKVQDGSQKSLDQFSLLLRLKVKMQAASFSETTGLPKVLSDSKARWQQVLLEPGQTAGKQRIIVIGASLGGTEATLEVLKNLPGWLPGIVVVQHMPGEFTKAYAMRLNKNCQLQVEEAANGDLVENGHVYIAKGGEQLTLKKIDQRYVLCSKKAAKVGGFCPAVDVLFHSAAEAAGAAALGILLTGLGRDGAAGLLALHDKGAYTIGQDEATSVAYGMPGAAYTLGAVDRQAALDKVSQYIVKYFLDGQKLK